MRQINTKFFLILVGSAVLLTGGVFALHRLQAGNIAQALLWQAGQAEKGAKLDQAARYLGRYLEFVPSDLEERSHLGTLLADPKLATTSKSIARARFVIEQVLAKDPQRHALRQDLVRLALATRQLDFAKDQLAFFEKAQHRPGAVALLTGEWHELQPRTDATFAAAILCYQEAIAKSPGHAEAYLRLATLYRKDDFGKPKDKRAHKEEIRNLVSAALAKLPNDPGILSLAAQIAQDQGDAAKARAYLENGLKQNPAEHRLYLALASVEGLDGKRADALHALRRGLQEVGKEGKYELTWTLANVLLDDNQVAEVQKPIADIREVSPRSAEYLEARVQMLQGRWFEAARTFERLRPHLQPIKELAFQLDIYLGACYESLEEPALQLAAYRRAAANDKSSLAARRGLATALWSLGQVTEALEKYRETIETNPDAKEKARWQLEFARLLLLSRPRELHDVQALVEEAEKVLPGSVDAALVRAELAIKLNNRRDDARPVLVGAQRANPERFETWMFLAGLSHAEGKKEDAARLLHEAQEKIKDSVEFRLARTRFWGQQPGAESEKALRQLEGGLDQFTLPQQARLLQALSDAHLAGDRVKESVRLLRLVTQLPQHSKDLRVRLQLLELALYEKDDEAARAVVAEMKTLEEGGAALYSSYGEAVRLIWHARQGQRDGLEEARRLLTLAAAQRPNWHAVALARAEIDERQGKDEQAIANYRLALQQGSRDPKVMKQLIFLLSQAQRFDEADAVVHQMQEQFREQLAARESLQRLSIALAYNRKDLTRAESLLKQTMQTNSRNFRDHLWLGQLLMARSQASAEAEAKFRRAVELGPEQPEAWVGLVRYLAVTDQPVKARLEIKLAESKLPAPLRALTLAQCHEVLGDPEVALKHYQKALKEHPDTVPVVRGAADFYLRTGRLADAEALFRRLLDRQLAGSEQDLTRARRSLALALVNRGRPGQVAEALKLVGLNLDAQGRLAAEKTVAPPEEQLAQARVLAALPTQYLHAKAIPLLEGLQQKRVLPVEDQFLLARLLHEHGLDTLTWHKTRDVLRDILESAPNTPRYLAFAAGLFVQKREELAEAEKLVARLERIEGERKLPAGSLGSVELRARCLEVGGKGTQAVALLKQYASQEGATAARALLLAALYGRLGQFKEAIDICEHVANQAGGDEQSGLLDEALGTAVALLRAGKPAETEPSRLPGWQEQVARVEARYRVLLRKDTGNATSVRLQLADLMEMLGRTDEVEQLCRRVLADEPLNLVALNNLAWLLGPRPGKAEEALTLVSRAIEKYGPRPELLDTRAVVYLSLDKSAEAVADLQKVVSEAPTPPRYFHLSRAHHLAKNTSSAQAALRRAEEIGLRPEQLHPSEQGVYRQVVAEVRK